jgi:hypothetical protein
VPAKTAPRADASHVEGGHDQTTCNIPSNSRAASITFGTCSTTSARMRA